MGIPFDQQHLRNDPPWVVRHEPPTKKGRGRPPNHPALEDFTLELIDRSYLLLCRLPKPARAMRGSTADHIPTSERAYRHLASWARKSLKNISWRTLANKHTSWKRRSVSEEDRRDSEDFDAEIERQFPHRPTIRNP
ncbi:hypothetical protein [Bradyrhizobium tunisiense]|uniref:hypothetical protein n=1 Tax=Bradyrhizobium tunisiense TaxID=3278709 RepID=UPI0035E190FA